MKGLSLFILVFLIACNADAPRETSEANGALKHIVLLDLKESCSEEDVDRVVQALNSLSSIEQVMSLKVSRAFDSGDDRLIEGYDLMLYTEFADEAALKSYSTDTFHLSVREEIKLYMASRPKVIDAIAF